MGVNKLFSSFFCMCLNSSSKSLFFLLSVMFPAVGPGSPPGMHFVVLIEAAESPRRPVRGRPALVSSPAVPPASSDALV